MLMRAAVERGSEKSARQIKHQTGVVPNTNRVNQVAGASR